MDGDPTFSSVEELLAFLRQQMGDEVDEYALEGLRKLALDSPDLSVAALVSALQRRFRALQFQVADAAFTGTTPPDRPV